MDSSMISLLITSYHPFPSLSLLLPSTLPLSTLSSLLTPLCPPSLQSLSLSSGLSLPAPHLPLSALNAGGGEGTVFLRLAVKLLGGKGGFASQLRAQGGKMSSNKNANKDSCRDLNGRRLSTIKAGKNLAAYIESEPQRKAAAVAAQAEKVENLTNEINRLDHAVGGGTNKRRLEDTKYVEESREMIEGVKDAVKEAMMKKRKKAKLAAAAAAAGGGDVVPEASGSTIAVVGEAVEEVIEEEVPVEVEVEAEEKEEKVKPTKGKGKGKGKARA